MFFLNRGASSGAESLSRESQAFPGRLFVSHSFYTDPPLVSHGTYAEAEPLYGKSQAVREKLHDSDHPEVAKALNNRALLLDAQARLWFAVSLR